MTVVVSIAAITLVSACGQRVQARLDESSAALLVPDDEKYLDAWRFTIDEAPNNYTARAHWDPTFNPDIDRSLTVESWQINDPVAWTGRTPADGDEATRDAFVAILSDSATPDIGGPCETLLANPAVQRCVYDVARVDPVQLLLRRFDGTPNDTVMLVVDSGSGLDYISGSFSAVDPKANQWLDS